MANQLKKCSSVKELECVYATMVKTNANQDCFLANQFVSFCTSRFHRTDYAILAFTQMQEPNVFVYNALIRGLVHCGHPHQAIIFYLHMLRAEVLPTSYTFSSLIKACSLLLDICSGEAVHGQVWKNGFGSHVFVQTALVDYYSNSNKFFESRSVFDEMPQRDIFSWTTMVLAHARAGDLCSARRLFDEMPERNIATWNTMIDAYARLGNVQAAELLFNKMPARDIISWTTMITCYSQNNQFREALDAFNEMKKSGISPDQVTMATVLSACAHLGALDLGREIHLYVMQIGFDIDVYIGSALIDMYAKCGSLDRSLLVFFKLREKNLFCWNSIIEGLAAHGFAHEALAMFDRMIYENVEPNGVTFISVLSACTHAGLVEEGRRRFLSMTCGYSITPEVEHYGCMVDLLSKAGLLEDALELIRSSKFQPNAVIWGALLGGCKLHRNLEIAHIAVNELMILEPNNSGYCTLLLNMYAEVSRWAEVTKIRVAMKELGIEKRCPGSSWIEMERKVYQFAASDKSHPASDEIYSSLSKLDEQLKLASYVSPLPVSQLPQKPFSGKVELVFFAREAIKAKGIRVIQFAAFAKQRMLRLIRLKIKNKMKGHHLILILLSFLLGLHSNLTQPHLSFAHEMYDGQLFIKLEKCFNLPAMDPWITHACSTGFLGTSDPYVFMELDGQVVKIHYPKLMNAASALKCVMQAAMEVLKDGYQELHLNPPLVISTGQGSVAGEGYDDTKPMLGDGTKGGGPKTTNLTQLGARVHGGFGGEEEAGLLLGGGGSEGYAVGGGSLGLGIGVSASEWVARESGVAGLGDSAAFGGDSRPRQAKFWVGQGRFGPSWARDFSPIWGWARSSGFAENGVDSGGWRRSMARNWAGLTQFGADFGVRKLKMLIFESEDAYGWVYRVERYFAINGLSKGEKLMAAALCLEGKTLMWFQWREQQQPLRPWGEFKDRLLERFRTTQEGDLHEQFFVLIQEKTIMEYRKKFELLSGRLGDISEAVLEGNFMKGPKLEI
ncbi:pentatricopeptide repeat-containing protein [Citrus sinensis]|nr:pentatricopeptide repeat-containing protein [Citrus sinensis]